VVDSLKKELDEFQAKAKKHYATDTEGKNIIDYEVTAISSLGNKSFGASMTAFWIKQPLNGVCKYGYP
jgi:hypothetical protein